MTKFSSCKRKDTFSHIDVAETEAADWALKDASTSSLFAEADCILLAIDNKATARSILRGGSKSHQINTIVNDMIDLLLKSFQPDQIGLVDVATKLNVADALTRLWPFTSELFDASGASAVGRGKQLDRHWRNARTAASHNPLIYKQRIVGDWEINGSEPPYVWQIGSGPATASR